MCGKRLIAETLPGSFKSFSDDNGLDKKTLEPTHFVDIKSEGLRDILRTVLGGIRTVNLNEDKLTVWLLLSRLLS